MAPMAQSSMNRRGCSILVIDALLVVTAHQILEHTRYMAPMAHSSMLSCGMPACATVAQMVRRHKVVSAIHRVAVYRGLTANGNNRYVNMVTNGSYVNLITND